MTTTVWTHPSAQQLAAESPDGDPMAAIQSRARDLTLAGLEGGWVGPPFDPVELAERLGVLIARGGDVRGARLASREHGRFCIECDRARDSSRTRFAVARALGRLLLSAPEGALGVSESLHEADRADDWQVEALCNLAAAELLMPVGAFPPAEAEDLSLPHLLELRSRFGVSTEAVLRRVVLLTERPAAFFACARLGDPDAGFRVDYVVGSRAWAPDLCAGATLPAWSVLGRCSLGGALVDGAEVWGDAEEALHVQAVALPPYAGHRFPRVVGLLDPAEKASRAAGLEYLCGEVARPSVRGPSIIVHVTRESAELWPEGPDDRSLASRYSSAAEQYSAWAAGPDSAVLGAVHLARIDAQLWLASLVAEDGGAGGGGRLRLGSLRKGLERVRALAQERSASVHLPLSSSGRPGTWAPVRDLVIEELLGHGVPVSVYLGADRGDEHP